jgi:hypothetical protein
VQSEHVEIRAAALSQSEASAYAVPVEQSDASPTHELGYMVLYVEQKANPIVDGDWRHAVQLPNTVLGGKARALHPSREVAAALEQELEVARHA